MPRQRSIVEWRTDDQGGVVVWTVYVPLCLVVDNAEVVVLISIDENQDEEEEEEGEEGRWDHSIGCLNDSGNDRRKINAIPCEFFQELSS